MPPRGHFQMLFEYAPISLWEEDFSGIKSFLDDLRAQGVTDLKTYLDAHPEQVEACMKRIQVLDVNQQTLSLLGAASKKELLANLESIFRDEMRRHMRSELLALWGGELTWSGEGVNYTLQGRPVDIRLNWRILPGHEDTWSGVLVTLEDITEIREAERRFQALFETSPISIWQEDYSAVKQFFEGLRAQGVTDLEEYLRVHPGTVAHCMRLIRVTDVNQKTLELFKAGSKPQLISSLEKVFRDEMGDHFKQELLDLWNGRLSYQKEGINYSLDGEPINVLVDLRVMPGHEEDFRWVQVAIQDITSRKKAENYLRYLGTHDALTGLYNRAYFEEQMGKAAGADAHPSVGIILADMNGLKMVNDQFGHQAGDALIRRAAEVLKASFSDGEVVARIGGDEFASLLHDRNEADVKKVLERIQSLILLNNRYYHGPELSISVGYSMRQAGELLEKTFSRADQFMYREKDRHYQNSRK